jgi:phosphohistidine swiveling domain-containing protein
MSLIVQLDRDAPAEKIGGKARSLVKLAAAGLPVPPAIAVTTELFSRLRAGGPPLPATLATPGALKAIEAAARALHEAPWPAGFAEMLAAALAALDGRAQPRFVVRSSAAIEDRPDALGAGLFLSRLDLPAAEVEAALREVLASALAPGVVAYLARRSLPTDEHGFAGLGMAALIHPFVAGDAAGSAALDSSHGAPVIDAHQGDATRARTRIQDALTRLTVTHGPVEVEWAATGYEVTFLQMRPYRRPTRARLAAVTQSGLHLGWHWDAAHNPLPLSPAQAGLVALVDRVCDTGLRQQTLRGYLFYSHAPRPAGTTRRAATTSLTEALAALRGLADARLAPDRTDGTVSLDEALDTFLAIYQPLFGVVQPAARAARKALLDFLQRHGLDPAPRLARLLTAVPSAARERTELTRAYSRAPDPAARATALAGYLDRFGDESPCWDVAVPTWRETFERLDRLLRARVRGDGSGESPDDDWRAAADAVRAALPASARPEWSDLLAEARSAVAAAEDDDALYARAQAHVRRALLREGSRLAARGLLGQVDEIFWLPLDLVRREARRAAHGEAGGETTLTREEAARLVDDARRADADARKAPPSLADAGRAADLPGLVRGRSGAGGVCIGRVEIWNEADADAERGADRGAEPRVIVARTILPTELPLIAAAALVVETGGPLDHVAAQARERGIPAVVGALGALTAFAEGDRVLVDGDAGLVARID